MKTIFISAMIPWYQKKSPNLKIKNIQKLLKQDNTIVLRCTKSYQKENLTCSCRCHSYILPSEVLNGIIEKLPLYKCKYIRYLSKTMARSNPLVYDVNNYNINSFEIGKGHKCLGTELDIYKKTWHI